MNRSGTFQLILLFIVTLTFTSSSAEIYQWKDQQGRTHFGDKKPQQQNAKKLNLKINTYSSVSFDTLGASQQAVPAPGRVELYSTDWCKYCHQAKAYFKQNNIAYTEYNIDKNDEARRRYQKLGARGVPVIVIGNRRMNGFSPAGFDRLYRQ